MDLPFRPRSGWSSHVTHDIQPSPTSLPINPPPVQPATDRASATTSQARLFGCGFNGLGQVTGHHEALPQESDGASHLLVGLTPLFEGCANVKVHFAKWAYTVVQADDKLYLLGLSDADKTSCHEMLVFPAKGKTAVNMEQLRFFGTDMKLLGAIAEDGRLYELFLCDFPGENAHVLAECRVNPALEGWMITHVAITYPENVAIVVVSNEETGFRLLEFNNIPDFQHHVITPTVFPSEPSAPSCLSEGYHGHGQVTDLVAGSCAYAMLTLSGEVFTWGSWNHPELLGRVPDQQTPADVPHRVDYLAGLVVTKIAGEGTLFGALTQDRDVYLWGMTASWRDALLRSRPSEQYDFRLEDIITEQEVVCLVDIDDNVVDFDMGTRHIMLITEKGHVKVVGDNRHHQCGIANVCAGIKSWTDIAVRASKVSCGPLTTFLHK